MKCVALTLVLIVPLATSAQAVGQGDGSVPVSDPVDVLPTVASDDVPWPLVAGLVAVVGAGVFVAVAGEELEIGCLDGSLLVVGAMGLGILAGNLVCGSDASPSGGPSVLRSASGASYDLAALGAFASGEMTAEQRRGLAAAARAEGREAVVLRRVVARPAGVGLVAAPEAHLEVAVLDAETAAWRAVGDGPLAPTTTVSVPVGDDLEAASADAMRRVGFTP